MDMVSGAGAPTWGPPRNHGAGSGWWKRWRKRAFLIGLVALIAALIAGCSGQGQQQATGGGAPEAQPAAPAAGTSAPREVTFAQKTPPELIADLQSEAKPLIVDVREAAAYKEGHVQGAVNIPFAEFAQRLKEVPEDRDVVLVDDYGRMGQKAAHLLVDNGYYGGPGKLQVWNLSGGMIKWLAFGGPIEK